VAAQVEHGIGRFGQVAAGPHLFNDVVPHKQPAIGNFAPRLVHGDENGRILNQ